VRRYRVALDVMSAVGYGVAGSVLLVAMAMLVVMVEEPSRKAAAIVLAVAAVWLLSRSGAILSRLLFGFPQ